jgi:hypothetical protein
MDALKVVDTEIRQDPEGRYSLSDLHRAAGGQKKHTPSRWHKNSQTNALIGELEKENKTLIRVYYTAQKRGAFVVKELVYSYAMWVSPAFNLRVIRAFDALVNGEFVLPSIQHENYWFARRPHWPPIRLRVLAGEAYRTIAEVLKISRHSVARAVKSMIRVGLLSPMRVALAQKGPAKRAALRYGQGWGQQQLLPFGVQTG